MRVLCCGDRNWTDFLVIRRELSKFQPGTVVIEGGCPWRLNQEHNSWASADKLAKVAAEELGFAVEEYPVISKEWRGLGKKAGPIRNKRMLDDGKPDLVLAFRTNIAASKGTKDMVAQARARGIEVRIIDK